MMCFCACSHVFVFAGSLADAYLDSSLLVKFRYWMFDVVVCFLTEGVNLTAA